MILPQELQSIFRHKQASYKMVLILALLESVDENGQALLDQVTDRFRAFYLKRASDKKTVEAPDKAVFHVESLTIDKAKSLILDAPYQALKSILIKTTTEGRTYLGFKRDIWEKLDNEKRVALRKLAEDELQKYYAAISSFSLRFALHKIMNEYLSAKTEPFRGHTLGEFMRVKIPEGISSLPFIDERYKVQGSVGQGNWARVPWIAIMDKDETETTQDGVYVVYLFSEDMQTVYLTLNQGVTRPLSERGRREGYQFLQQRAEQIRSLLPLERMTKANDIFLTHSGLGSDYQVSTIAYIKYSRDNLPDDEQLISDLEHVLENYRMYLDQEKKKDSPQTYSLIQEEQQQYHDEHIGDKLTRIQSYIRAKGFYYSDRFIDNFYLSLKTKPFVILAGIKNEAGAAVC